MAFGNKVNQKLSYRGSIGYLAFAVTFYLLLNIGCLTNNKNESSYGTSQTPANGSLSTPTKIWYEGGTLQDKTALQWQTASETNKLATCADYVTKMWKDGYLKPEIANKISTVDDIRPYAQELVNFLNTAFKPYPDPEQNQKMFANQTVADTAAIGMVMMGWITAR